jgi:hypothetical protein
VLALEGRSLSLSLSENGVREIDGTAPSLVGKLMCKLPYFTIVKVHTLKRDPGAPKVPP